MIMPTAVRKNQQAWETFWESGGAVDLSGSKDSRWERAGTSDCFIAIFNSDSIPATISASRNRIDMQ